MCLPIKIISENNSANTAIRLFFLGTCYFYMYLRLYDSTSNIKMTFMSDEFPSISIFLMHIFYSAFLSVDIQNFAFAYYHSGFSEHTVWTAKIQLLQILFCFQLTSTEAFQQQTYPSFDSVISSRDFAISFSILFLPRYGRSRERTVNFTSYEKCALMYLMFREYTCRNEIKIDSLSEIYLRSVKGLRVVRHLCINCKNFT